MKARILVIDDEAAIRDSMKMILEYEGYEFLGAATGEEGIALVERESVDLVFLDIKMPGMDGLEVLGKLKAAAEGLPVVMISGHGTVATAVEATKLGAFDFIEKPLATERILLAIRNALGFRRLRDENESLARTIEVRHEMVGASPALRVVLDAVTRAAPTSATVLIRGESGVGKELVARMIHKNSLRARERFVQVNCAAIPEELIESELFGHEKGSFTGATEKQIGKFEQADRGTIFLDEVGDMSLKTQAKVLRVLQEGEVERVGSSRTLKVDVRVIAATNKDLEQEIEEGQFREDLFFRLSVIPIFVPPLRERGDDIPALVRHFAEQFTPGEQLPPEAFHGRGARRPAARALEGQRAGAAQHHRARDHHDARRRRRPPRTCPSRSARSLRPPRPRPRSAASSRTRCASSRRARNGRSSSRSSARTTGTSPGRPRQLARRAVICTRSSNSTTSARRVDS